MIGNSWDVNYDNGVEISTDPYENEILIVVLGLRDGSYFEMTI